MKFLRIVLVLAALFVSGCGILGTEPSITYNDILGKVWYYKHSTGLMQTHLFYCDSIVVWDDCYSTQRQTTIINGVEVVVWDSLEVYLQAKNISNYVRTYTALDGSNQTIVDFCLSAMVNDAYISDNCVWNQYAILSLTDDTMIWQAVDDGGQMRFHAETLTVERPLNLKYSYGQTYY